MAGIRTLQSVIVLQWRRSPLVLYAVTFLFCTQVGILMIALPWRVIALGGDSATMGAIGAIRVAGYILCCLLVGPRADRLGVKRLVMVSAVASAGIIALMPAARSVWMLLVLVGLCGVSEGMFWPPLAGWVSAGQEGARLNKRLGTYNFSLGAGLITGSLLGGPLWGIHPNLAFAASAAVTLVALLIVAGARKQSQPTVQTTPVSETEFAEDRLKRRAFHLMAIIAGVTAGMTLGIIRYPMVALIDSMSLGPNVHAPIAAGISLALMCGLYLMGRTARWHYRPALLWIGQIVMVVAVCAVAFCRTGWELGVYVIAVTLGVSVVYASDLYYSVSGSTRRAASVAKREIRVTVGFAVGSFGGGVLGRLVGLRGVYPIMAAIIVAAVLIQVVVYYRTRINLGTQY